MDPNLGQNGNPDVSILGSVINYDDGPVAKRTRCGTVGTRICWHNISDGTEAGVDFHLANSASRDIHFMNEKEQDVASEDSGDSDGEEVEMENMDFGELGFGGFEQHLEEAEEGAAAAAKSKNKTGNEKYEEEAENRNNYEDTAATVKASIKLLSHFGDVVLTEFIQTLLQLPCLWDPKAQTRATQKSTQAAYRFLASQFDKRLNGANAKQIAEALLSIRTAMYNTPHMRLGRWYLFKRLDFLQELNTAAAAQPEYPLRCSKCQKGYMRQYHLEQHERRMHPLKDCAACKSKYCTAEDLYQHICLMHSKDARCPLLCGSAGPVLSKEHLKTHFEAYGCYYCGRLLHDYALMQIHRTNCILKTQHSCYECGASFDDAVLLKAHALKEHQNSQPFRCRLCEKKYNYPRGLKEHARKKHTKIQH